MPELRLLHFRHHSKHAKAGSPRLGEPGLRGRNAHRVGKGQLLVERQIDQPEKLGRQITESEFDQIGPRRLHVAHDLPDFAVLQRETDDAPRNPGPVEVPLRQLKAVAFEGRGEREGTLVERWYGQLRDRAPGIRVDHASFRHAVCFLKGSHSGCGSRAEASIDRIPGETGQ